MTLPSDKKIEAFEYFKGRIKAKGAKVESKLVLMKLLFFTAAYGATEAPDENGLLDIFDSFSAMPYGHVESDVYRTLYRPDYAEVSPGITTAHQGKIDAAVEALHSNFPHLFTMEAMQLVDLSHRWYSWKVFFKHALQLNKRSVPIPVSIIKREPKIFV